MSSELEKSICKSIYVEDGFDGIVSVLSIFPTRLHDEMLEDLSMNMCEWETKLSAKEKEEMKIFLEDRVKSISEQNHEILSMFKELLSFMSTEGKRLEKLRETLVRRIQDFPSILPETDISSVAMVDVEIDSVRKRVINIGENIDKVNAFINKRTERLADNLFQ